MAANGKRLQAFFGRVGLAFNALGQRLARGRSVLELQALRLIKESLK
jgi:hypothetical protein